MPIHIHLKFGEKVKRAEEDKVMFKRISDKNGKKWKKIILQQHIVDKMHVIKLKLQFPTHYPESSIPMTINQSYLRRDIWLPFLSANVKDEHTIKEPFGF